MPMPGSPLTSTCSPWPSAERIVSSSVRRPGRYRMGRGRTRMGVCRGQMGRGTAGPAPAVRAPARRSAGHIALPSTAHRWRRTWPFPAPEYSWRHRRHDQRGRGVTRSSSQQIRDYPTVHRTRRSVELGRQKTALTLEVGAQKRTRPFSFPSLVDVAQRVGDSLCHARERADQLMQCRQSLR